MPEIKTWDEWTDVLGQTYRPGDYVAYASVNGRSPQLVIAEVIRINRVDSKGHLHLERVGYLRYHREMKWPGGENRPVTQQMPIYAPSCSVTVRPVIDARGFYRSGRRAGTVTLKIPQNVIKVDWTQHEHVHE